MLVTISGLPGSGTTTVSRLVAEALGLERVPGGEVFRAMAAEAGMSLAEFGAHAQGHPEIDLELDARLAARAHAGGCVIESRLAGWLVTNEGLTPCGSGSTATTQVRAARVADAGRVDLTQALLDNAERHRPRAGPLPGDLRDRPRRPLRLRPGPRLQRGARRGGLAADDRRAGHQRFG